MESREQLEKRVADLEKQVSALKGGGLVPMRGLRKRAAWGIGAVGAHVVDAMHRDPEAETFFRQYGLAGLCHSGKAR